MAKKAKKVGNAHPHKNKKTEEKLSEALEIVARAYKVLEHAEDFIQRMQDLANNLRKGASFVERDDGTIDRNDMAHILCGIANTIETAMEV